MKKSLLHIILFLLPSKLISVAFVLFAVNCSLLTVNCYSQWVQQTVPTNKPIVGIKFIDTLKGWAIASAVSYDTCFILHTSNGGTNWYIQYTSINTMYSAISVVDSNVIYAGGGDLAATANLTKTTNGGINWAVIPTPTNMGILDMQFLNKDSGWTCEGSTGPDVRTTTNGGLNWTVRTSGINSQTQRIFFLNYNTGFCAANSFLYRTTDAGLNWTQNIPVPNETVYGIFFLNINTGWVSLAGHNIGFTTNSGLNWTVQNLFGRSENIYDIYFIDNIGWAASGWIGKILKTTDMGQNWGYQLIPASSNRISIVDTQNAWAANGGISHTINGGGFINYLGIKNVSNNIPEKFTLSQNYPNPFNPTTKIKFDIKTNSNIKLIVYDVLGRELFVLVNEKLKAGSYEYSFDAGNLPSGTYFYRLQTENYVETKKMVLLK